VKLLAVVLGKTGQTANPLEHEDLVFMLVVRNVSH
jgi:hypothetical protein